MKIWRDVILKRDFCVGDEVLPFNSWLKLLIEKLKSKWLGCFMVVNMYINRAIESDDH